MIIMNTFNHLNRFSQRLILIWKNQNLNILNLIDITVLIIRRKSRVVGKRNLLNKSNNKLT